MARTAIRDELGRYALYNRRIGLNDHVYVII
jgi:hypothetical protein